MLAARTERLERILLAPAKEPMKMALPEPDYERDTSDEENDGQGDEGDENDAEGTTSNSQPIHNLSHQSFDGSVPRSSVECGTARASGRGGSTNHDITDDRKRQRKFNGALSNATKKLKPDNKGKP